MPLLNAIRTDTVLFFCDCSVQETCNFDALFSYLTCGNYDFRYDLQKGVTEDTYSNADIGAVPHQSKHHSLTFYCSFVSQLRPRRSIRNAMSHGEHRVFRRLFF